MTQIASLAKFSRARRTVSRPHLSGLVALQAGKAQRGVDLIARAIAIQPDFAPAHNNLGNGLRALQRAAEALVSFDTALAIEPEYAEALCNRAIVLRDLQRPGEALASLDRSLALTPGQPLALFNRGMVLKEMDHLARALADFRQALALKPDFAEAMVSAGLLELQSGQVEAGLATFRRHAELVHANAPAATAPPHRARHDAEQRAHLAGKNIATAFHLDSGARLAGPAVNPGTDAAAIARQWQTARPRVVVIDNVLKQEALDGLRRFCQDSTVWCKSYDGGYVGTIPEHGIACPLLAQIAGEFRRVYPAIFSALPLRYLWGF